MITFLGIIIFAIPFISIVLFKDKMIGFLSIFTMSFILHLLIALATQALGIFKYEVIIAIYSVLSLAILVFVYIKHPHKNHRLTSISSLSFLGNLIKKLINRQNSLVIIAFVVVFFNLLSVHYNFTGTVNSYGGSYEVKNSTYIYPYFSDEWVAIAFVNYTIESQSIPAFNPLTEKDEYHNPLVPYFSFLSDIFLFFGFDPLDDYEFVNLLVGMFICLTFFMLLLSMGIDKRVATLSVLIIPYITNGGNLPGIWFLIPMTFALIFYLISLIGFAKEDNKLLASASLLTICLYPPFIVFVLPVLFALVFRNKGAKIKTLIKGLLFSTGVSLIAIVLVGSIVFSSFKLSAILDTFHYYFFRTNLVGGYLSFPIWVVLPLFVLPFAIFGIFLAIRKKLYFILLPLFTGLAFWLCYVGAERVLIIDFPRIVVITAFLILIFFGIAFNYLAKRFINEKYKNILTAMCIFVAMMLSLTYTENDSWRGLMLHSSGDPDDIMLSPAPTASRFLTEDDLTLFSSFTKKYFISPPWKGLVISAATGNYPMATKPSTVGVFTLNYDWFVNTSCKEKDEASTKHNLSYAYSTEFDCPNFIEQGESSEGLVLYKFIKK